MSNEADRLRLDARAADLASRPELLARAATGLDPAQAARLVDATAEWLGDTWNEGEHHFNVQSVDCAQGRCDFELEVDGWWDDVDLQRRSVGFAWAEPRRGADIELRFFTALGEKMARLCSEAPERPAGRGSP